jgi:DNA-binding transcriptional LysR family regulator
MPAVRDLNKLNVFVRVAENKSFTKTARDLRTNPSIVSKHMNDLEQTLGFSLFRRSTHGLTLTDAGEGLLENCLTTFANLDDYVIATRNKQTGPYGSLRVYASPDYARWVLTPLLPKFVALYPKLRLEVITQADLRKASEETYDVVIASTKPLAPGLVGAPIGRVPHVICASPRYFKRNGKPEKPEDLKQHNCLSNFASTPGMWRFRKGRRGKSVKIEASFFTDSIAMLCQLAVDGLGIVRLPLYAVRAELVAGKLQPALQDINASYEDVVAYYPKTGNLPAKITAFIEFVKLNAEQHFDLRGPT